MRAFDARTTGQVESDLMTTLRRHRSQDPLEGVVPPWPLKVQVQTWTRCNAACAMCPYPEITEEPGFVHQRMGADLYQRLLDQLSPLPIERFSPFLMNEPLLDKRMPEWVARARKALPHTTINLFTNGTALRPELAIALAEAGLDELCVSVHGFDPEVNREVMGGIDHQKVIQNLLALVPLRAQGRLGQMHLQIVAGDVPEIARTLALAPEALRPLISLKAFSNEREVSQVQRGLDSSAADRHRQQPLCQRPFVKLYVMADGACVACNCDWRRRQVLGHLEQGSVTDIWRGAGYRALRKAQVQGAFPEDHLCHGCDYPLVADL